MSDVQTYAVDRSSADPDADGQKTLQEVEARIPNAPPVGSRIEPRVSRRLKRGESVIGRQESRWRELWAHFDGDQYVEQSVDGKGLVRRETREGGSKPRWRSRLVRNRYSKVVLGAVSVVCSRMPGWEVVATNADRDKVEKALLAQEVLFALMEPLQIRKRTFLCGLVAGVTGDGYVFPHWDPTVGKPILEPDTGKFTGKCEGDIRIKVLRQDQVMWQPNQAFEESRWYAIRDAQPVEDVVERAIGAGMSAKDATEKIKPDASTAALDLRDGDGSPDLVFVYHYFERPAPKTPQGRYLCFASNITIEEAYPYPIDRDEPCIHRFAWIERPNRDRGLGIGELIIDVQRAITRIVNQLIAWRNLVLVPQMLAPENSLKAVATDEPGIILEYRPTQGFKPEWRPVPEIPVSLFKELELAYSDMDFIAGGTEQIPVGVESGSGIGAVNEREQSFRAHVIANLSAFYSSLGRHLLCLVRQHYTEERLLTVSGRFGSRSLENFLGTDLDDDYASVRVSEASLTPMTRAEQEAKIMAYAERQWITPAAAMAALQTGTAQTILDRFELDVGKAHRQIGALKEIGQDRLDPESVPFAGPQDDHLVQAAEIKDWMKTVDYEKQHEIVQILALSLIKQHEFMVNNELDQEAAREQMRAVANGMQNAGKPQPAVGMQAGAQPGEVAAAMPQKGQPSMPSIQTNTAVLAGDSQNGAS